MCPPDCEGKTRTPIRHNLPRLGCGRQPDEDRASSAGPYLAALPKVVITRVAPSLAT